MCLYYQFTMIIFYLLLSRRFDLFNVWYLSKSQIRLKLNSQQAGVCASSFDRFMSCDDELLTMTFSNYDIKSDILQCEVTMKKNNRAQPQISYQKRPSVFFLLLFLFTTHTKRSPLRNTKEVGTFFCGRCALPMLFCHLSSYTHVTVIQLPDSHTLGCSKYEDGTMKIMLLSVNELNE